MNKYSQKYHIIQGEMDANYRLKITSAIMYSQDCFARYLTSKNLGAFDLKKQNLCWIISEFDIRFFDELPFWSEQIEVTTWVSEISRLKIFVDFEIKYNNVPFAKGNTCWILLNYETRRPAATDIIANQIEICPELTIGEHKKFKLSEIKEKTNEFAYKTNLSDIDFNNHVNNRSYINIAGSSATEEFESTHIIKRLAAKFNRESFLNDTLICSTYNTDEENTYVNKIEKDGSFICDIITSWAKTDKRNNILDCDLAVRSKKTQQ